MVLLDLGLPDMDGRDVFRDCATAPRRRSSCSPPAPRSSIACSASSSAPTTTSPSRSASASWSPASAPSPAAHRRAAARRRRTAVPHRASASLTIDRRTRRVHIDDDEVQLTAKEFDLLAFLATDIGAVRTRTEILENVWDAHWYGPTKTVDAHVASLRKKLGNHEWIQAVRGVGFRLEPPE